MKTTRRKVTEKDLENPILPLTVYSNTGEKKIIHAIVNYQCFMEGVKGQMYSLSNYHAKQDYSIEEEVKTTRFYEYVGSYNWFSDCGKCYNSANMLYIDYNLKAAIKTTRWIELDSENNLVGASWL